MNSSRNHTIQVASYNIHRCIGTDRRHDPTRIARVIRELRAEVVGLQEVSSRFRGEGAVDQVDYLRNATGMEAIAGPCLIHHAGHFGNALLTCWPVQSVSRYDLSVPGREPRAALEATLNVRGSSLRVVVTHFGLRRAERARQARLLIRFMESGSTAPAIVLGDCNRWLPTERSLRCLDRRFGPSCGVRSFPANFPILALERVWVERPHRIDWIAAHATRLARSASDHLPVKASVLLGETRDEN